MKFRDFIKQLDAHFAVRYRLPAFAATDAVDNPLALESDDIREFWEAGYTPAQAAALMMGDHSSPALDNAWMDENDNVRFWRE